MIKSEKIEITLQYGLSKKIANQLQRFDNIRKDKGWESTNMQSLIFIQEMIAEHMSRLSLGDYERSSLENSTEKTL